ncbi:hypothetical protein AX16_008801 [Volvariella volvacea WC 439]|nr:hypothetical protein AX16_008801 [Volvariella volvacea WC 439]
MILNIHLTFSWLAILLPLATSLKLGERDLPQLSSTAISTLISKPDPIKNVDPSNPNSHLSKILIPPDTANNTLVRNYIVDTLKALEWHVELDEFDDETPVGRKHFANIIATKDPKAPRRVIVAAHFDSKYFPNPPENQFVGATDSAAPCAMMLDLAEALDRYLNERKQRLENGQEEDEDVAETTLQLVFFDGEEAFVQWTDTDSIYGARHLAEKWASTFIAPDRKRRLMGIETEMSGIEHLILLDLLGAPQPLIRSYFLDTAWLFDALVSVEKRLGDSDAFTFGDKKNMAAGKWTSYFYKRTAADRNLGYMGDDHVPFLRRGVSVLHLIADPFPRVWHQLSDNASALDIPTMRRWNIVLRVFISEYLHLRPEETHPREHLERLTSELSFIGSAEPAQHLAFDQCNRVPIDLSTIMSAPLSVAAYNAQRAALIQDDRLLRRENRSVPSQLEKEADAIVRRIRAHEAASIWSAEYEGIPHPFPGMEFLTGRDIIVKTKLFEILTKMPKGALLHAHFDATVNVSYLLKLALSQPTMHISVPSALTASTLKSILPVFKPLHPSFRADATTICGASYTPGTWVTIQDARQNFDATLRGAEGFDEWVVKSMTINPSEAYGTHNTITKIWQKFQSTFMVSGGLISFVPIFTEYLREFLRSSIADKASYLEPRMNFWVKHLVGEDGQENVTHRERMIIFDRVVKEVKNEMIAKGREQDFIGARIIYTTLRFITPEELDWYLEDCIALKKEFPHLIAGFDLVGDENVFKPLSYYLEPLLRFQQRQKEEGVDIPFIFHAGETLGDGTDADTNLYDAILLGTKRIGHGFSIVKHPKLLNICRERGIALEVCPISNEILVSCYLVPSMTPVLNNRPEIDIVHPNAPIANYDQQRNPSRPIFR